MIATQTATVRALKEFRDLVQKMKWKLIKIKMEKKQDELAIKELKEFVQKVERKLDELKKKH